MKTIQLTLILCGVLSSVSANADSTNSPPAVDPLVEKYDVNHNGKIDASEHREYVRALSRQRQAEARTLAAQRPELTPDERRFFHPPQFTPELLKQYDANQNGKLDLKERLQIQKDAAEAAKQEFRRYDVNGDGKLDQEELKAVEQARQQKPAGGPHSGPPIRKEGISAGPSEASPSWSMPREPRGLLGKETTNHTQAVTGPGDATAR